MKPKIQQIFLPILIFIISLIGIYYLIPQWHPAGGLKISKNKETVLDEGKKYLANAGISFNSKDIKAEFSSDKNFIDWINVEHPLDEANRIILDSKIAYYWELKETGEEDSAIVISSNSNGTLIKSNELLKLKISDDDNIFSFGRRIKSSSENKSLTEDEAETLAQDFVSLFRPDIKFSKDTSKILGLSENQVFYYKEIESSQKSGQTNYTITWNQKGANGIEYLLDVVVLGGQVEQFDIHPNIPAEFKNKSTDIFEVVQVIIYLLIILISVVVFGFKRFRAYEIGFKEGIIFGAIVLLSYIFKQLFDQFDSFEPNILVGLFVGGIFISGSAIILWSVSETVFREVWNDKFLSFDLIFHKKFTHSIVGKSLLNGVSFGLGLSALFILLLSVVSLKINTSFTGDSFLSQSHITSFSPPLSLLFGVINSYAILAVSFFMFLTAAIKRFISNDLLFILISGLIWTLLIGTNVNPLTAALPLNLILGILLSLILIKYDLLTTILSYLLFHFYVKASEFSFIEETALHSQWFIVIGISVILIVLGIIFILKKDKFFDYNSITPKYVENVTERQRLSRELDVAKHVQMSFLPKESPQIDGLDIASVCIPALEVGGDYYDFIQIDKNKFGIIIGDVSGKGTQAAFYMTLTKGFIKALAKQTDSPSEVLSKMNELFYENVERGRFISMIYAIVDLDKKNIRIARAGHNPVIQNDISGDIKLITPTGLALGLEKGKLFRKVITEFEENLESGKNYIFYTDGFTEAVNKKNEEYGMERLSEIIKLNNERPANEIMDKTLEDLRKFIGKAKQHDDMTMVVLKVK